MLGQVVHRFVRNPNIPSSLAMRVGNRSNPFANTLSILEDPANKRKLFLIGTTNSSTLLANRTRKLIEKEKPETVFLQTNPKWANIARMIQGAENQEDFDGHNLLLRTAMTIEYPNNARGLIYKFRLYTWLFLIGLFKGFPRDFHPFTPGLEMKLALDEAEKLKSKVIYGGVELDEPTQYALLTEKRMDFLFLYYKGFGALHNKLWKNEHKDHSNILHTHGGEAFAESMDRSRLNWFIKYFEKLAPRQKKILVDNRDIDLFHSIYRAPGSKIVAVVNQWHVPGIEAHWRACTNTIPEQEPINPVGDFDIEKLMEANLVNDKLREIVSKIGKTEPATWSNYITTYIKESTEYHRVRHVSFMSHDDPDIYHGLPYGSHDHDDHGAGKKIDSNHGAEKKIEHVVKEEKKVEKKNSKKH